MSSKGSALTVAASADDVAYSDLGQIKDGGLSSAFGEIDDNDFDTPDWVKKLIDRGSLSITGTYTFIQANAGQAILRTASQSTPPAQFYMRYRALGDGSGLPEVIYKGQLSAHDITNADGAVVETSFTFDSADAPTFQDQP